CTYLIVKVWRKWNDSPVIVSFDETSTPVWDIPFPAVTICSEVKVKQTLFNFTEVLLRKNKTKEEKEKCEHLAILCDYFSLIYSGFEGGDILNVSDVNYLEEASTLG
ncbi:unnamed protein product, partial [Timema podura]|nr:unnamed protein product [Timema podura]